MKSFLLLIALFASNAFAIKGTYLDNNNDFLCIVGVQPVYISVDKKVYVSPVKKYCTGTIINRNDKGNSTVITAAHCFEESIMGADGDLILIRGPEFQMYYVEVHCGEHGNKIYDYEFIEDAKGKEILTRNDLPNRIDVKRNEIYDVAVLTLPEHADISCFTSSIKLSAYKNVETTFFNTVASEPSSLFVKDDAECRMAGYGFDNNDTWGTLHTGAVGKMTKQQTTDQSLNMVCGYCFGTNGKVKNMSFGAEGDSGGPLYCKKNGDTAWTLVGILYGGDYTGSSRLMVGK